jgi:hypothetical protein
MTVNGRWARNVQVLGVWALILLIVLSNAILSVFGMVESALRRLLIVVWFNTVWIWRVGSRNLH